MRRTDDVRKAQRDVTSAISNLKEIVTIISGLAAANAVLRLMELTRADATYGSKWPGIVPSVLFTVAIVFLLRFYYGNVRLLDHHYDGEVGRAATVGGRFGVQGQLAADFVVIVAEAMILTLMGFLLTRPTMFLLLTVCLLAMDVAWLIFSHLISARSIRWLANNSAFLAVFAVMLAITLSRPPQTPEGGPVWLVWAILAAALANTVLDLRFEWDLYFPNGSVAPQPPYRVFVGAPFTAMLQVRQRTARRQFDPKYRRFLERVLEQVGGRADLSLFSAHLLEVWGEELRSPQDALLADLDEVKDADVLVAIDAHLSPGLQLEIGYALGAGTPIIYLSPDDISVQSSDIPYLSRGLVALTIHATYRALDAEDCARKVFAALDELAKQWVGQGTSRRRAARSTAAPLVP